MESKHLEIQVIGDRRREHSKGKKGEADSDTFEVLTGKASSQMIKRLKYCHSIDVKPTDIYKHAPE